MTSSISLKVGEAPLHTKSVFKWLKYIMNKCAIYLQVMVPKKDILTIFLLALSHKELFFYS